MNAHSITDAGNRLAEHAADSADSAVQASQFAAVSARYCLAASAQHARREAGSLIDQAGDIAQHCGDALRDGARQVRLRARRARRESVAYIQDEPVKAVLIAAAVGAALVALLALLGRPRDRG